MLSFRVVILILLASISSSGCTTTKVTPVDTTLKIKYSCLEDCKDTCFDGEMMSVLREGLERNGITTRIYTGSLPSECEYHLSVMCERTWDMAMYMHHAELRLYRAQTQIGYAEYHLTGKGGLALTKFGSTKSKMDPIIDELLMGHPINTK